MTDKPQNNPKLSIWFLIGNFIRGGLLLFLAVNLYAMALRFVPVPTTILMTQRSLSGEDVQRDWTRLEDISPYIVEAVMAGEDSRFCEHKGIDWAAIEQAFEDNQEGGKRRGGSTITQQTAKNVFFWNGGGYIRKAGEAWFANLIDFTWGKPRVMEVYLNVAEWGDGIFGVEAAAQNRFGKSAKALTQQEAALLAAVLPSPNKWRLDPPSDFVKGRAGTLRKRMRVIRESGYAKCVSALSTVKIPASLPAKEIKQSEETLSKDEPQDATTLDDLLNTAKEVVDDSRKLETESEVMAPKPEPEIPQPTDPNTPTPSPEVPQEVPSETPLEPPIEIPEQAPPLEVPEQPEY